MPTIYQVTMVALICAFIELTASKTGIRYWLRDWCDKIGLGIIAEMFECDFCFSFWLSVVISVALALINMDPVYISIPVFASPIIRILI